MSNLLRLLRDRRIAQKASAYTLSALLSSKGKYQCHIPFWDELNCEYWRMYNTDYYRRVENRISFYENIYYGLINNKKCSRNTLFYAVEEKRDDDIDILYKGLTIRDKIRYRVSKKF